MPHTPSPPRFSGKKLPARLKDGYQIFSILAIGILAVWLIFGIWRAPLDNDSWFLLATGQDIAENGFSRTNPWFLEHDLGYVPQQWLYAMIMHYMDKMSGMNGNRLFFACQLLLFYILAFSLAKPASKKIAFIFTTLAATPFAIQFMSIRPELVSLLFLLLEILGIKKFVETNKGFWLIALPVSIILEMNMHAALWPLHFLVFTAFAIKFPWPFFADFPYGKRLLSKKGFLALTAMCGGLFCSPYGMDMIAYPFAAYFSGMYDILNIYEMNKTPAFSMAALEICLLAAGCFIASREKTLGMGTVNIFAGFSLMASLATRDGFLLIIPAILIIGDLAKKIQFKQIYIRLFEKDENWEFRGVAILIVFTLFIISGFRQLYNFMDYTGDIRKIQEKATEYLIKRDAGQDRIMTGFDIGGSFERKRFINIYMDPRMEIFMKTINGKEDILRDYGKAIMGGLNKKLLFSPARKKDIENWLAKNSFDWIIVDPVHEKFLAGYMLGHPDYKKAAEFKNKTRILIIYEKNN